MSWLGAMPIMKAEMAICAWESVTPSSAPSCGLAGRYMSVATGSIAGMTAMVRMMLWVSFSRDPTRRLLNQIPLMRRFEFERSTLDNDRYVHCSICWQHGGMGITMSNLPAVSLGELCKELGEIINRATFAGERTAVTRHGRTVAAIVSVEDLALLDELERRADLEALREAHGEDDGTRVSLGDFLAGSDF